MSWAEFEEKEYEIPFCAELRDAGSKRTPVFAAGPVLEKVLGYDEAADPDKKHPIWQLLQVPRPAGLRLLPSHWVGVEPPAGRLPEAPVSLILQFKRPEYLRRGNATQWPLWEAPYFRFWMYDDQQDILQALEDDLGSDAVIRYAAPTYWEFRELEATILADEVLRRSTFVAPSAIGAHAVWTFDASGKQGKPNPEGEAIAMERIENVLAPALERPVIRVEGQALDAIDAVRAHVNQLGQTSRRQADWVDEAATKWAERIQSSDVPLEQRDVDFAVDFAATVTLLDDLDTTWHLA